MVHSDYNNIGLTTLPPVLSLVTTLEADLPQHDDHSWNIMGKSSVNMNVESRFGNGHCTLTLP